MRYQVIITDVTDYGTQHCVAGWDIPGQRIIRPEPAPASFWQPDFVGAERPFWPGNVVEFEAATPQKQTYPHATEDVVVDIKTIRKVDAVALADLPGRVANSVAPSLQAIFGDSLQISGSTAYVLADTNCSSLGAVEIARDAIQIFEDTRYQKRRLRGMVRVGAANLKMSITGSILRRIFLSEGLAGISAIFPAGGQIHMRIGLARPFDERPNKCYVQINGIYQIP